MKRLLTSIILILCLALSLFACDGGYSGGGNSGGGNSGGGSTGDGGYVGDGGDGGKGDYYPGGDMGDGGFDPEGDGHYHSMVYHPSNYAGCADVSPEYWHCSSCGKDYFDPDGYDEVPDPSILDVDHIYGEWIIEVPADCTNEGTVAH